MLTKNTKKKPTTENTPFGELLTEVWAAHREEYDSVRAFASAAGLAKSAMYDMMAGYVRPTPRTLEKLESVVTTEEAKKLYRAAARRLPDNLAGAVAKKSGKAAPCPPYYRLAQAVVEKIGGDKEEFIALAVREKAAQYGIA